MWTRRGGKVRLNSISTVNTRVAPVRHSNIIGKLTIRFGSSSLLSLLLLLLTIVPFIGSAQGSPDSWVSLDVDGELMVSQYPGVSYAVEDSGVAHVSYYDWDYSAQASVAKYAIVRGSEVTVMTLGRYNDTSQLVSETRVDALGQVHILWEIERYLGSQIWENSIEYYVLSNEHVVEITDLTTILGLNLQYAEFALAADGSGNAHIALIDFDNNLHYITDLGGFWTSELVGCVGNSGGGVSIAVDDMGAVHMSYVNRTDYLEYYYTLRYVTNAGGSWATTEVLQGDVFPISTSIALDSTGHVFIGCLPDWVDPENNNMGTIGYATDLNGPFEVFRTPFQAGMSGSRWFSIDRDGDVRLVYNNSMMSTGPVMSNAQWATEIIPGGAYVEEDSQGHLHTFYFTSRGEWYNLWLEYASDKFEKSSGPGQISAASEPGSATLSWTAPADTGGLPVLGYYIFYGTDPNETVFYTDVGPTVGSYTFANLSSSGRYYFLVAPVTLAGVGANSSIAYTTPLGTPAPEPKAEPVDHTSIVVGSTIAAVTALAIISTGLLRKAGRARVFAVLFVCWAIAFTSILPVYFANASWISEPDTWSVTTIQESVDARDLTAVALDAQGFCHVAAAVCSQLLYSTNASGDWTTVVIDPDTAVEYLSMVVDSLGSVYIAYENYDRWTSDPAELRYATNSDGAWALSVVDNRSAGWCSIALGHDGAIHIGYSAGSDYNHEIRHATSKGDGWDIGIVESSLDSPVWMGDIGISSTDEPRLIYVVGNEVHYASYAEGRWVLTMLDKGYYPSLFIDSRDIAHVCYCENPYEASALVYATENEGGWDLRELGLSVGHAVKLEFDQATGNITILFRGASLRSMSLAEGKIGNLTETAVTDIPQQFFVPIPPAMALTPSGEPVICTTVSDPAGTGYRIALYERDLSDYTLSERMAKGWAPTQASILVGWVVGEALIGLVFLVTWRVGVWRRKVPPEKPIDLWLHREQE